MNVQAIYQLFTKRQWTLSTAESCTGGSIAAYLTSIAGASNYFLGGVVGYANSAKTRALGVEEALLASCGAVSEEVAVAMCRGVRQLVGSDCAVATTGVAGPSGGTLEKPVGTVWIAVITPDKGIITQKLQLSGGRESIVVATRDQTLELLLSACK